jgi:hypothetical protein
MQLDRRGFRHLLNGICGLLLRKAAKHGVYLCFEGNELVNQSRDQSHDILFDTQRGLNAFALFGTFAFRGLFHRSSLYLAGNSGRIALTILVYHEPQKLAIFSNFKKTVTDLHLRQASQPVTLRPDYVCNIFQDHRAIKSVCYGG